MLEPQYFGVDKYCMCSTMEKTSGSGKGRMAMAQAITFEEFEGKTYQILLWGNRLQRQKRAMQIFVLTKICIFYYKGLIELPKPEFMEADLEKLFDINKHLRESLHNIITKLRKLQPYHPRLFNDLLLEQLEEMREHFDNEVETLELALDPEIKEGIHKVMVSLPKTKDDGEPWRDSLAKI